MGNYEYNVLPAPRRGKRAKGFKGDPARFSNVLTELMNAQAAEGWEYVKSETFPMEVKQGMFKGSSETTQCVLVFRRALEEEDAGEIVSMTQAAPQEKVEPKPAPPPPVQERLEPVMEPPKQASRMVDQDTISESQPNAISFDENNVDPLKNLVEDHRGPKIPDNS